VEELESRIVLTLPLPAPVTPPPLPLPSPLVPDHGDQQILDNVLKFAVDNRHVLYNLPVPYVIVASAGGAAPAVTNGHSHSPVKIDADQSEATGQGGSGFDIQAASWAKASAAGSTIQPPGAAAESAMPRSETARSGITRRWAAREPLAATAAMRWGAAWPIASGVSSPSWAATGVLSSSRTRWR
jgi:hypothetical protein